MTVMIARRILCASRHELGHILPLWDQNSQRMTGSLLLVVIRQSLPETIELHPYNRIAFLVEIGGPTQRVYGDAVFLNFVCGALKVLLADIGQQLRQTGRTIENSGSQDRLEFALLRTEVCRQH